MDVVKKLTKIGASTALIPGKTQKSDPSFSCHRAASCEAFQKVQKFSDDTKVTCQDDHTYLPLTQFQTKWF